MKNKAGWVRSGLLTGLVLLLGVAGLGYCQRDRGNGKKETIEDQVGKKVGLKPETITKVLEALGPVVVQHVTAGEQVVLPGLGTLRVVRIPEHRDLREGRPVTVAGTNYVEFVPTAGLVTTANGMGVVPAATVPQFEYVPRPNEVPSMRAPKIRASGRRSP